MQSNTMTMVNPKISVIVPVYKAEAYLHRCIDSILAQTFKDFELLLIDDGSPDRSGEICDEYARKDCRVKVYHKSNGGVSSARQYGLDNAIGEYVIHADPDDWIDADMYEKMYNVAVENNADMVICDFQFESPKSRISIYQNFQHLDNISVLKKIYQYMYGSCWNKFIKRSCLTLYNIHFPLDLFYGEDLFVNTCLLSFPIKIEYVPSAFYHYDQVLNNNSLVRRPLCILLQQSKLLYELLKKNISSTVFHKIECYLFRQQAILTLRLGRPYINTFKIDYICLKEHINIEPSFKNKLLLIIAFKLSPNIAHCIIHWYTDFVLLVRRYINKIRVGN